LDEVERDTDSEIYENLNFRFGLRYNPLFFSATKSGLTVKLVPCNNNRTMIHHPMPDVSGSVTIALILTQQEEADLGVGEFSEKFVAMAFAEQQMKVLENEDTEIAGYAAKRIALLMDQKENQKPLILNNYLVRKDNTWAVIRSICYRHEAALYKQKTEEMVKSFYFF